MGSLILNCGDGELHHARHVTNPSHHSLQANGRKTRETSEARVRGLHLSRTGKETDLSQGQVHTSFLPPCTLKTIASHRIQHTRSIHSKRAPYETGDLDEIQNHDDGCTDPVQHAKPTTPLFFFLCITTPLHSETLNSQPGMFTQPAW